MSGVVQPPVAPPSASSGAGAGTPPTRAEHMLLETPDRRYFVAKIATGASHDASGEIIVTIARVPSAQNVLLEHEAAWGNTIMDMMSNLLVELVRDEERECPEI